MRRQIHHVKIFHKPFQYAGIVSLVHPARHWRELHSDFGPLGGIFMDKHFAPLDKAGACEIGLVVLWPPAGIRFEFLGPFAAHPRFTPAHHAVAGVPGHPVGAVPTAGPLPAPPLPGLPFEERAPCHLGFQVFQWDFTQICHVVQVIMMKLEAMKSPTPYCQFLACTLPGERWYRQSAAL